MVAAAAAAQVAAKKEEEAEAKGAKSRGGNNQQLLLPPESDPPRPFHHQTGHARFPPAFLLRALHQARHAGRWFPARHRHGGLVVKASAS